MTIQSKLPKIEAIDRSQLSPNNEFAESAKDERAIFTTEISQARSLGADVIITGTFARLSDQIGVSLLIVKIGASWKTLDVRTGLVPISKEIADLTPEPIPGLDLKDGVPRAGSGGIGVPICIRCPAPEFPLNVKEGGVVLLEIVVTLQGRAERIKIMKSPSPKLAASAVRAVQSWLFRPATGFDGSPTAVIALIEVTFHGR